MELRKFQAYLLNVRLHKREALTELLNKRLLKYEALIIIQYAITQM